MLVAPRVGNAYNIDMRSASDDVCFFARADEHNNWLWHKRLCHMNFKNLNTIATQDLVRGIPLVNFKKDRPCSACELGKMH